MSKNSPSNHYPSFFCIQVKTGVFTHQADILSPLRAQLTDNLIARQAGRACARSLELHSRGDNLISQPATALAIINMSQSALFMDSVDTAWQTLWRRSLSARAAGEHTIHITAARKHINAKTRGGGGDCWMRESITQEPRRSRSIIQRRQAARPLQPVDAILLLDRGHLSQNSQLSP